ncbi:Re/Si-specific NAD(P)(+) transhydrogenase subunit alpha [Yunchengibacter salinarum]|uniref:Re/Si-specific NAD(P)(+) transhydrogenase subunit alpha n=1 Tax=Yunchengibacter salinarum TaxID=3133399 RepID=UPI0035B645FA
MKLFAVKEQRQDERRVALSAETARKFIDAGLEVTVESGAGVAAAIPDKAYEAAGATLVTDRAKGLGEADIILSVQGLESADAGAVKSGAFHLALLNPFGERDRLEALAKAGITAFSMEFVPRITRAQSMDVLSSQANLAGYRAVLDAAHTFGRAMPMMMTAAGTIPPAKVLVMGAGVAGLQAIATAKRLGAVVHATDVRPAAKEQVESLGGKFVMVEDEETEAAETEGGYAREMSDAYKKKQAALIEETIAKMDLVITTAQIPGRPAPELVSDAMIETMKPGSVIVDLAVETGGNVSASKPGEVVEHGGVTIVGHRNVPSLVAADASQFLARNLMHFLSPHIKEGRFDPDMEDQIIQDSLVCRDGAIVHERLKDAG